MDLFCHAEGALDKLETEGHKTSYGAIVVGTTNVAASSPNPLAGLSMPTRAVT